MAYGWGLSHGDNKDGIEEVKNILQTFKQGIWRSSVFCTHRVIEYHCWIKATNGQVERVYSHLDENIVIGEPLTEFEHFSTMETF